MNISIWNNSLFKGIEFANISYYHHVFKPHFHDHYVILTLKEGINTGVCKRQPYTVTNEDVLIINPSEVHTGSSWNAKYLNYVALYVSADFFLSQLNHLNANTHNTIWFQKTIIRNSDLADQLREIVNESQQDFSITLTDQIILFFATLFEDLTSISLSGENKLYCRSSVKKGVEFIRQNYNGSISISDYCRKENISCYSFIRSFQKFTGLTPGQFLINFRIEKAKKLLQQQLSVSEACWDTGFFDQSHFNRHFKSITGTTPGLYRKCFVNG